MAHVRLFGFKIAFAFPAFGANLKYHSAQKLTSATAMTNYYLPIGHYEFLKGLLYARRNISILLYMLNYS